MSRIMKNNSADLLVIVTQNWVAYGACRDRKRAVAIKKTAESATKIVGEQLKRVLTADQANAVLWQWTNGREGNGDRPLTVAQARAITAKLRLVARLP